MRRIAGTIISTRIMMLTPIGRLLPLVIIPPGGIPVLVQLPLVVIVAKGIPVLIPLPLVVIAPKGVPVLVPLAAVMAIPTVGIAVRLIPLAVLAVPAIGISTGLLPSVRTIPVVSMGSRLVPPMRLIIPGAGMGTRLGRGEMTIHLRRMSTRLRPGESLTIRLRGKRTIGSGLGAQGAQGYKKTQRKSNGPPSFWSHLIILLKLILHSDLFNSECRPGKNADDFAVLVKNSSLNCRISPELRAASKRVGVVSKEFQ